MAQYNDDCWRATKKNSRNILLDSYLSLKSSKLTYGIETHVGMSIEGTYDLYIQVQPLTTRVGM